MRSWRNIKHIALILAVILIFMGISPASASSANISHSYASNENIPIGSLVSLEANKTNYVDPANSNNSDSLLGVAVTSSDSLIAEDPSNNLGSVQVATAGTADALVSTLNGSINVGDQISVSPYNGVGIKAISGAQVIGLAQTSFNSSTQGASEQYVKDTNDKIHRIWVGFIKINIAIGQGPTSPTSNINQELNGLVSFSKTLTGHAVSTTHVIVSLVVAGVALVAVISLIYSSIYGGIISIGRNPLAKFSILKSMLYVLAMVLSIIVIASILVYLLLR